MKLANPLLGASLTILCACGSQGSNNKASASLETYGLSGRFEAYSSLSCENEAVSLNELDTQVSLGSVEFSGQELTTTTEFLDCEMIVRARVTSINETELRAEAQSLETSESCMIPPEVESQIVGAPIVFSYELVQDDEVLRLTPISGSVSDGQCVAYVKRD